ncbi:protein kinase domain-containing protein [Ditylenchus destructor]|nr:protein kinase domain-containing protein [Ditylenchus destructor]
MVVARTDTRESSESFLEEVGSDHVVFAGSDSGFYNSYEPKEILGRGLASTVRRCIEKGTGQTFAVKIVDVSTERQTEQEAIRLTEETLSEVQLLRQLAGHPSIIAIHGFFSTPTFLFAVFEMAPKGELFDLLNKSVTFSEKKTRSIMGQLFDGVQYMHSKNIVHRDLKLENILCIDETRIIISDFGFAKQLAPQQKLKDLFGTPGYLAPETLKCQMYEDAEGYGLEVDNWALGVIMYTLLAGYAPFYHRQQLRMMRLIQEGRYEFNKEQWDLISDDAKDLIRKLLTVEDSKRIKASECLLHRWMTMGARPRAPIPTKEVGKVREPKELRRLMKVAQLVVRFICRLKNMKYKLYVDRTELRKRPFRNRQIRHEAEAASFAVYGHWVNRGFYYSRDMLFANKPRPKYARSTVQS